MHLSELELSILYSFDSRVFHGSCYGSLGEVHADDSSRRGCYRQREFAESAANVYHFFSLNCFKDHTIKGFFAILRISSATCSATLRNFSANFA